MSQVQVDVCVVNEQGQLICGTSLASPVPANSRTAIQSALGDVSPQRLELILSLIAEVLNAPIEDSCIELRTGDIAGSVHDLLQTATPVMLLYRYVALPGNIMATYYIEQDEYDAAREALDDWRPDNLKQGCP